MKRYTVFFEGKIGPYFTSGQALVAGKDESEAKRAFLAQAFTAVANVEVLNVEIADD